MIWKRRIVENDPLRKAKFIVEKKPRYLCVSGIGVRYEFSITYPAENRFELVNDVIPYSGWL